MDESDELWREFCDKDFKNRPKESRFKTWRKFYNYLLGEREEKLKKITEGISSKARKAVPGKSNFQKWLSRVWGGRFSSIDNALGKAGSFADVELE